VGATKGFGGEHWKNQVSVIENGVKKRINIEDYDKNKHIGITKGKTMYEDSEGNTYQCTKNDPRVLSGELVGINKGNKFLCPNSKGQMVRINIYNEKDEIVNECYGNFGKICKEMGYPIAKLRESIKNGKKVENARKKCYNGWYAIKIKGEKNE
jgi:hypothetical protein